MVSGTKIGHFQIFCIYGIFGNPCFLPKTWVFDLKTGFWPKNRVFAYSVFCFVLCKIWFWRNTENTEYRLKRVSNFAKVQNSQNSAFRRALIHAIHCSREFVVCHDLQSKQSFSWLQCQCIQIYNHFLHSIKVIFLQVEWLLV